MDKAECQSFSLRESRRLAAVILLFRFKPARRMTSPISVKNLLPLVAKNRLSMNELSPHHQPRLTTSRLILRRWAAEDRVPFARLNADPRVMQHFPSVLDSAESDRLVDEFERHFDQHGFGRWAVEVIGGEALIGFVGLGRPQFSAPFMPCVEIGWRLAADHWGRGYATEAAEAALRFGFTTAGLPEVVSFTATVNLPSRRVMEKLGMQHHPAEDFDHPRLPREHRLCRHVLYRLTCQEWQQCARLP